MCNLSSSVQYRGSLTDLEDSMSDLDLVQYRRPIIRKKVISSKFDKDSFLPLSERLRKKHQEIFDPSRKVTVVSNTSIVLIVAYMRTGSTLVGSLFQEYPGSFYVFEPLRAILDVFEDAQKHNNKTVTLKYIEGKRYRIFTILVLF